MAILSRHRPPAQYRLQDEKETYPSPTKPPFMTGRRGCITSTPKTTDFVKKWPFLPKIWTGFLYTPPAKTENAPTQRPRKANFWDLFLGENPRLCRIIFCAWLFFCHYQTEYSAVCWRSNYLCRDAHIVTAVHRKSIFNIVSCIFLAHQRSVSSRLL